MDETTESPADEARATAFIEALLGRFPERFSAGDVEKVRQQVLESIRTARRLRTYPLSNADEPDPVFHAVRSEG